MSQPEDGAIPDRPALALLEELGWSRVNLMSETPDPANPTGRTSIHQTICP
jgi:type I restriction enzyme R subunit